MGTIIYDQNNKPFELLKTRLRSVNGTRYATKSSIFKVLDGRTTRVVAGSAHPNAKKSWPMRFNQFQVRIGCRVFRGENRTKLLQWATTVEQPEN